MNIDHRIAALRLELRHISEEKARKTEQLHDLFLQKALDSCPLSIGSRVEYEPGKFGEVDRIGVHVEEWKELEDEAKIHWTVAGRKINKTGEHGLLDFTAVGPATHFVNGTSFKVKGLAGVLGVDAT